jgi:transcription elongation factor GreA
LTIKYYCDILNKCEKAQLSNFVFVGIFFIINKGNYMEEDIFLTPEGLEKTKEELERLKTVERREVAKMIGEAKSYGDLSENSEYDAAKTKEAQLELKILELEDRIKRAKIISKDALNTKIVNVGSKVTLFDEEFDEDVTYTLMGATDSDPLNGIISNCSPLGKAILGQKVGSEVVVETPSGLAKYKIKKIEL